MHVAWLSCTWKDFLQVEPDLQFEEIDLERQFGFGFVLMHVAWLSCTWKDFLRVDPDLQFADGPAAAASRQSIFFGFGFG